MLALAPRALVALRALVAGGALLAMTACSGGGSTGTNPVPNYGFCGNDTSYALASPRSGSFVSGNQSIEIVANGNNNQIYQSYQNFQLVLQPQNQNFGGVTTGPLSLTSDRSGYAPFSSDYYYSAQLQGGGLVPGSVYNVYVNAFTSNCTPVGPIGQLYT